MIIDIYLLTEEQCEAITAINNSTQHFAVICDYGTGPCITAGIDNLAGYEAHQQYLIDNNIQLSQVESDIEE